ncbi:hypothetical protein F4803DRAFT_502230 [Xylaria telfairii]|nr:hypothetical protein F4803DRAFT_502230 [Xylaria telfairii]
MTSIKPTGAEAPVISGRIRLPSVDILLDNGMDSDDDEEGGTSLTPSAAPAQSLDDVNAGSSSRNENKLNKSGPDTQRAPNNPRPVPKTNFSKRRILDWFLGRHAQLTSDELTGLQAQDQIHGAVDDCLDIGDIQDICPACTTSYCQAVDSIPFTSSLKLIYNDTTSQKWLIGNKYILHEALDGQPEDEYVPLVEASRALRTLAPNIPILKVRAGWKENGRVITITDTVPGERLYDIWWDLSDAERENIAKQVALHIESWRESDLGRISSLIGGSVHHHDNLFGSTESGFGPFGSDLELWQTIEQNLKQKGISEATIQVLKDYMPPSSPCVFTHGDLSSTNILIHKGEVAAITGFENAASLPAWAEDVSMHFCYCAEDEQWKALLIKYTRSYRAALDWWSLWTAAEDGITNEAQVESLKDRCMRWKKTEIRGQPFWSIWLSHEDGAPRRLNIQTAEDEGEVHVGHLIRQAIMPDLLQGRYGQEKAPSERSWGYSSDDEGIDGDGPKGVRKRGLTPYHQIQQQHHSLVGSASGPPRHALETLSREHRDLTPNPLSGESTPIATIYSEAASESGDGSSVQSRPQSRNYSEISESAGSETRGLRPLSLPSLALSESTHHEAEATLSAIREDGPARRAKRTSMFGNRVVPGSLYAALSERPKRSKSEERTRLAVDGPVTSRLRQRPKSMMQPSFRHPGLEGRGRVRDGDEKYGFR